MCGQDSMLGGLGLWDVVRIQARQVSLIRELSFVPWGLYPWVWVPKPWNMVLNKGIWDPKPRVTDIKGTSLKSSI